MIGECWEVDKWSREPRAIKIIRETAKTAIIESRWGDKHEEKIRTDNRNIFPTWEEAKAWMVKHAEEALEYAKREVDRKRSELEVIKALKRKEP